MKEPFVGLPGAAGGKGAAVASADAVGPLTRLSPEAAGTVAAVVPEGGRATERRLAVASRAPYDLHAQAAAASAATGLPSQQNRQRDASEASEALHLVDHNWGFAAAGAAKLLSESGGGDFQVIGVLGSQGAGKSSLLNDLLYGTTPSSALAAAGTPPFATAAAATAQHSPPPANTATGTQGAARSRLPPGLSHCTSRIEMRVNPCGRTILLDSPPLWSASWMSELASSAEPPLSRSAALGPSSGNTITSKAIAAAAADPVIDILCYVNGDGGGTVYGTHTTTNGGSPTDSAGVRDGGGGGGDGLGDGHGRNAQATAWCEDGRPSADKSEYGAKEQDISKERDSDADWRKQQQQQHQKEQHQRGQEASGGREEMGDDRNGVLHFWALPRRRPPPQRRRVAQSSVAVQSTSCSDAGPPPPPPLLPPLCAALLAMPCRPLALGRQQQGAGANASGSGQVVAGTAGHATLQASPAPCLQLSERDWLRGVERLWDSELQRCPVLERYYLARQRTVFAGGAGWPVAATRL